MKSYRANLSLLPALCAILLFVTGCGWKSNDGPDRFHVSGTVTFKGQPVHRGTIVFSPDESAGNTGPQGAAEIREGKYDTAIKGKGTVGGGHIVTIVGFGKPDENAPPKVSADGMMTPQPPLFPTYSTKENLPQKNMTLDIDVPDMAKR